MKFNLKNLKNLKNIDKSKLGDVLFLGALGVEIIALTILNKKMEPKKEESLKDLDEFTKERLVKQLNTLQDDKRKEFIDSIIKDGTFYRCRPDVLDRIDIFVLQEIIDAHNENVMNVERNKRR